MMLVDRLAIAILTALCVLNWLKLHELEEWMEYDSRRYAEDHSIVISNDGTTLPKYYTAESLRYEWKQDIASALSN